MTKLRNPFIGVEGYRCFGCCPDNASGLHLEFGLEADEVVSVWNPGPHHQGYEAVVHGGVQSSAIDETAAWFIMAVLGTAGVTKTMNVEYLRPVRTDGGPYTLRSHLESRDGNTAVIGVEILGADRAVCTQAALEFFLFPEHLAKKRLNYPGKEAFFDAGSGPVGDPAEGVSPGTAS